ncbi:hypothetical protein PGTUg99_018364 [Puccinia graminis f. sp. tritici]|uniref:Myb/SANT-like domain-containing protein n=1 Tax=Puccinia graminis f. sp. tritici TaxID=56615 RepID=A0A5B0SJ03_PUCGR|nr:hypothetical protein PGTUg99_018364 [Puccinia graminis f. sp. tritici]
MPPRLSKRPPHRPKLPSRPSTPPPHLSSSAPQPLPASYVVPAAHDGSSVNQISMSGLHIQSPVTFGDGPLPSISHMDWAASHSPPPLSYAQPENSNPSLHRSYLPALSAGQSIQAQSPSLQLSGTPAPAPTQAHSTSESDDADIASKTTRPKTLQWTSAMEKAALQLYYDAALEGKRSDNGFKSDVHQHVVNKLREQFPGSAFTISKCKSKLSQKEYDAFVACRNASGFGWDDIRCEVTASNEVWESFLKVSGAQNLVLFLEAGWRLTNWLQSHPQARRFRNQSFPEWEQLQIIFGASATGDAAKSLSQRAKEGAVRPKPDEDSSSSENNNPEGHSRGKPPVRKRTRQTTGAAFSSAIHDLIEAFAPQSSTASTNADPSSSVQKTEQLTDEAAVNEAVDLFQTSMAPQLAWSDLVVGFSVLEKPSKARMYLKLEQIYKNQWLSYEIKKEAQRN